MSRSYDVYAHTSPSGKTYVGWTSRGWRRRWAQHCFDARRGSIYPFHCAIRKYGPEAFTHAVIATVVSEAEAKALEVEWIAGLGTLAPGGYNATSGGDGQSGCSAGTRERIRQANLSRSRDQNQANAAARRNRAITPEQRAKISAANKGRKLSDDTRARMSAERKTRVMPNDWSERMSAVMTRWHATRRFTRQARIVWMRAEACM